MGETINFPGSNNKPDKNEKPIEGGGQTVEFPGTSIEKKKEKINDSVAAAIKTFEMKRYFSELQGTISSSSILHARNLLKTYTKEDLQSAIINSNENDWTTKPAFFSELINEFLRQEGLGE